MIEVENPPRLKNGEPLTQYILEMFVDREDREEARTFKEIEE